MCTNNHWEYSTCLFHDFNLHSDSVLEVILITLLAFENVKSTYKAETCHSGWTEGVLLYVTLIHLEDGGCWCYWWGRWRGAGAETERLCLIHGRVSTLSAGDPRCASPCHWGQQIWGLRVHGHRRAETWARCSPYRCLDARQTRLLIESRNTSFETQQRYAMSSQGFYPVLTYFRENRACGAFRSLNYCSSWFCSFESVLSYYYFKEPIFQTS